MLLAGVVELARRGWWCLLLHLLRKLVDALQAHDGLTSAATDVLPDVVLEKTFALRLALVHVDTSLLRMKRRRAAQPALQRTATAAHYLLLPFHGSDEVLYDVPNLPLPNHCCGSTTRARRARGTVGRAAPFADEGGGRARGATP